MCELRFLLGNAESRAVEAYWSAKARIPRALLYYEGTALAVNEDTDGLWPFRVGGDLVGVVCVNSKATVRQVFWLEKPASIGLPWTRYLIGTTDGTPEGVCAFDPDGDGRTEVFVCDQSGNAIWCFKPDTADHKGTWTGAKLVTDATDAQDIIPFDHDNDGIVGLCYSCEENAGTGGGIYVLDYVGGGANPLLPASYVKRTLYATKGTWDIASVVPDLTGDATNVRCSSATNAS